MTAKKKIETKDAPLTAQQVEKLNLLSAQLDAARKQLNEYVVGILDANGLEGTWDSLGIEGDPPVLKLRKNEG